MKKLSMQKRTEQNGYALLLVVFLNTVLLVSVMIAAPSIRTERQREKEQEMIWRGKQYVRGIKLFYRKNGRFPTSLDDLTKPKMGSLRFMRQAYKDPMNTQDGSWRLIYVGPAGQLIGSLKPPQTNLQFGQAQGIGTPAGSLNGPGIGPGIQTQPGTSSPFGQIGTQMGTQTSGAATGVGSSAASPQNPPRTTGTAVSADQGTGVDPNAPIPTGDT